ncbi:MAG: glycosyltransferase family 2 protein [Alcaligenaceae bacterium]|nr:glycosyltransferase family 2 protein [Alcaligenaceae bacterium]
MVQLNPLEIQNQRSKPTLAIAMIVKNEARLLAKCLESVAGLADEIVILDSGSTDETEAIARRYTDKFYLNTKWPGFGPQRQLAQSYVKTDWILWLDADEVVTEELANSIRQVLDQNKSDSIYSLRRLSWAFGQFIRYGSWNPDVVARLYPTALSGYNDNLVHESVIIPKGVKVIELEGKLLHYTYNSMAEYLAKSVKYAEAWAEQRAVAGQSASIGKAVLKSLGRIFRDYIFKKGFLDGRAGFMIAAMTVQEVFNKYAMLHYKSKEKRGAKDV